MSFADVVGSRFGQPEVLLAPCLPLVSFIDDATAAVIEALGAQRQQYLERAMRRGGQVAELVRREQGWHAPVVSATAGRSPVTGADTPVRSRTAIGRLLSELLGHSSVQPSMCIGDRQMPARIARCGITNCAAAALVDKPSPQGKAIRDHNANACDDFARRGHRNSRSHSSSVHR